LNDVFVFKFYVCIDNRQSSSSSSSAMLVVDQDTSTFADTENPQSPFGLYYSFILVDIHAYDVFTGSGEQFSLAMALEQYAEEILALADKYDVIPLKYHCERVLAERLTPRNVCEVLLFADTYSYVCCVLILYLLCFKMFVIKTCMCIIVAK
jgi:hypothetical protein